MITLALLAVFAGLALLGTPLFAVLSACTILAFVAVVNGASWLAPGSYAPGETIAVVIEMGKLSESSVLIAIPLFTLAGALMTAGDISRRLVEFARALVGFLPGGLALAAIVACTFFAALSGSSAVTILAVGGMLYPALKESGYSERYRLGLLTSCGAIGILAPPSLPLIVYGVVASNTAATDINALFIAGAVPGLITILGLAAYAAIRASREKVTRVRFDKATLWKASREGFWALLLPPLLMLGIFGGYATASELSALAVLYAFVIEVFVYKSIKPAQLFGITTDAAVLMGAILIILVAAFGFTNFITDAKIPTLATEWIRGYVHTQLGFLIALNLLLLGIGCVMDIFSAIAVVAPLVVPIAMSYGVDLVHLGIIFVINLEIGFATPPFGLNLFIASNFFRKSIINVFLSTLPFLAVLLVALSVITYFPALSTSLPIALGAHKAPVAEPIAEESALPDPDAPWDPFNTLQPDAVSAPTY